MGRTRSSFSLLADYQAPASPYLTHPATTRLSPRAVLRHTPHTSYHATHQTRNGLTVSELGRKVPMERIAKEVETIDSPHPSSLPALPAPPAASPSSSPTPLVYRSTERTSVLLSSRLLGGSRGIDVLRRRGRRLELCCFIFSVQSLSQLGSVG